VKKILSLVLVALFAVTLIGCGGGETGTKKTTEKSVTTTEKPK
jgi:hypothetical protein